MKNKHSKGIVTQGWGLCPAIIMLLIGGVGVIFFGLALIGVAVSPNIIGNLLPALVTVIFFIGSVWLLRRGIRGLGQYKSGKVWEQNPPIHATVANVADNNNGEVAPQQTNRCTSCGAVGIADENGCCEYCGTKYEK